MYSSNMDAEDVEYSRSDVDIKNVVDQTLETIASIWVDVYGANDSKKEVRLEKLKSQIVSLCDEMIHVETDRKDALIARVEESLAKKSQLEKLLNLQKGDKHGLPPNTLLENSPLVEVDAVLLNVIDNYKIIEESRLECLASLQAKEVTLCAFLDKSTQNLELENGLVPSEVELKAFGDRIQKLEQEKADLIDTFGIKKAELASLLNELGLPALSKVERSAINHDVDQFPVTKANLRTLKEKCEHYKQTKANYIAQAEELRYELSKMWPRIKRDPDHLEKLLSECRGYSKNDIDKLTQELSECKAIRKKVLKEVIQSARSELEGWWEKCCLSDLEKIQFVAFNTDVYNEDILTLHDMEIERLRSHYENYKHVYEMFVERKNMWERLRQLEDFSKDPQRLFNNRGGQLLMEEKERKALQKEIPRIEKKLKAKLNEYEEKTKKPFLYFGENIKDLIHRDWTEKEAQKENEKQQRKIANLKTIETESKLGSKPTLSATKRKLGTSQSQLARKMQKTIPSTPVGRSKQRHNHCQMGCPLSTIVPRTPNRAASTPDLSIDSVASYSTFQENLDPQLLTPSTRNILKTSSRRLRTPSSKIPQYGKKF